MANYTTSANLQKRINPVTLAQLADDTTTAVRTQADAATSLALTATAANITQAITDASLMIDSYVLGHLDVTDATVLAALEPYAANIALYYLYRRRYTDMETNPMYPAYQQSVSWLKDVMRGNLHVDSDPLAPISGVACSTTGSTRDFDSTSLEYF